MLMVTMLLSVLGLGLGLPAPNATFGAWVDVCASDEGGKCCAAGMETSEYAFSIGPGSWLEHEMECKLEDIAQTSKLATFENRGEQDCITKYLHDKYPGDTHSWAIGLRSTYTYHGVYEWRPDDATPAFTNWYDGYPSGLECVAMSMQAPLYGRWTDGVCLDRVFQGQELYAICERTKQ